MSLVSGLYVGTSALQASQNALNTTAHNLTNVDTTGYTRQQVQLSAKSYVTLAIAPNSVANQQVGMGVTYSNVKQVRDYFLDLSCRKESGRSMFYQVSTEALEEVESILGELDGKTFQESLTDLWTSIQELSKDPSNTVAQGLLVHRAEEFITNAVNVYDGLSSYQDNLNTQISQMVSKINNYGQQLTNLNDQIRKIEAGGVESANDLRDTRNTIIDEIAKLSSITYGEDLYGNVWVQIEGTDFVKGSVCYQMDMDIDATTGFYTPFWPQNAEYRIQADGTKKYEIDGAEVFNLTREISSDKNTDIGGLKAMLLARGDHRADYSDMSSESYDKVSQSVIMNIQAEFDQLIHNVVTKINDILAKAAGVVAGDLTLEDGTVLSGVRYVEADVDGYMRLSDGSPIQMFAKTSTDSYSKVTGADGKEYWVYNEENLEQSDTMYTLNSIKVNQELLQQPALLSFVLKDGSIDKETVDALKEAFTEEAYTLNPNVTKKSNFVDYYTDLVSQVANSGYVYRSIYENQTLEVEATNNARQQILGVSSDEELANMIKFQNAYNSASRYINSIDEMLEHIINTLAV